MSYPMLDPDNVDLRGEESVVVANDNNIKICPCCIHTHIPKVFGSSIELHQWIDKPTLSHSNA